MQLALLLAAFALGLWWISRGRELFLISARNGRVLVVRGRIPPGLLRDMRDVLEKARVRSATARGVRSAYDHGGARLVLAGVDENTAQRLRNTFGMYPISKLAAAPAIANPTLGQVLGFVWLAWLMDRAPR